MPHTCRQRADDATLRMQPWSPGKLRIGAVTSPSPCCWPNQCHVSVRVCETGVLLVPWQFSHLPLVNGIFNGVVNDIDNANDMDVVSETSDLLSTGLTLPTTWALSTISTFFW